MFICSGWVLRLPKRNVKHGLLDAYKYNKGYLKADWDLLVASTHSA